MQQKLSSLMDGEFNGQQDYREALATLNDEQGLATLEHYQLIREVLRGGLPEQLSSVGDGVRAAIDKEAILSASNRLPLSRHWQTYKHYLIPVIIAFLLGTLSSWLLLG